MKTINIHEAKSNLSRLLKEVQQGKPFVIAKAGKPIALVTSIEEKEPGQTRRLGFLAGQIEVPEDFDRMAEEEILSLFGESDASSS
jgi:prevent-host-death family protein